MTRYLATSRELQQATQGASPESDIAARLLLYIEDELSNPWEWGAHDCCSWAANWAIRNGWDDPMARWRGRYDSEQSARDYMAVKGGLSSLWIVGTLDVGMCIPDAPRIGDIGVVEAVVKTESGSIAVEEVGAIYLGKRWAMRSPDGLFSASVEPILYWRV